MSQKLKSRHPKHIIQSEAGLLTVDFIFGITIAVSLGILFFAFSFTLSMVEVAQYVAFSSARAMAASADTPETQVAAARAKYSELVVRNPVINPILGKQDGSFFLLNPPDVRNGLDSDFVSEYKDNGDANRVPQVGVRMDLEVKILNLRLVFIGPTAKSGESYRTKVTALLIREPSQQECTAQMRSRYEKILALDSRYGILGSSNGAYVASSTEDNGC